MSFRNLFTRVVVAILGVVGAGEALAARTTTYLHNDALGSVVAATNESGSVLWRKHYAPFGGQLDAAPTSVRTAYTGKEHDDTLGITNFGARQYDPEIGRFLNIDPISFVEDNTMSFNRYLYVNNNPYKYVDPDGEILNFAAKFVLDVGMNVAINYMTTGSLGVGMALKDSALGVLNPAKTVAKAGKLAGLIADAKKTKNATEAVVHANSKASQKAQHGYNIVDTWTGKVCKTGVSSCKLNVNGSSPRANKQANKWNKEPGNEGRYKPEVVANEPAGPDARRNILKWEQQNAVKHRADLDPARHHRP